MKGRFDSWFVREGDGGFAGDGAGRAERFTGCNTALGRQGPQYSQDHGQLMFAQRSSISIISHFQSCHGRFSQLFCCPGGPASKISEGLWASSCAPNCEFVITLPSHLPCPRCVEFYSRRTPDVTGKVTGKVVVVALQLLKRTQMEDEDDARTSGLRLWM